MSNCVNCFSDVASMPCPVCRYDGGLPESPIYLRPGARLGEVYVVGKVLGHGGFGVTYLGWDLELDMKVAIKEYLPDRVAGRSGDPNITVYSGHQEDYEYGLRKFSDEAKSLARFQQNPGIVSVYRYLRANNTGYMIMEYIDGLTLKEYLERQGGKIPFEQALNILMPVIDALRAVHREGLLHRDIAPDNIYITTSGMVKVIDFGAARFATREHSQSLSIILKPGYAPEEQYRRKGKQGPWTDVYAICATLYRAVTGEPPPEALDRVAADELKRPEERGVSVSEAQERALLKGLAVRAGDRIQSMDELKGALRGEVHVEESRRTDSASDSSRLSAGNSGIVNQGETVSQGSSVDEKKQCKSCNAAIDLLAELCPKCGVRQEKRASKTALLLMTFFFGGIGGHRFYLGQYWLGAAYLLFFWTYIPGVIALVEFIVFAFTDRDKIARSYTAKSGAIVLVPIIFIMAIGILAAIAIPAYQDYVARARVSGAVSLLSANKTGVMEYITRTNTFPTTSDLDYTSGRYVEEITSYPGELYIQAKLSYGVESIGGHTVRITLDPDSMSWSCSSEGTWGIPWKYLPASCRN